MAEFGESLSNREIDVLRCMADGSSNKEIAAALFISENTVKVHLRNVYTKLGVSSRTEAAKVAIQQGAIESHIKAEPEVEEVVVEETAVVGQTAVVEEPVIEETTPEPQPQATAIPNPQKSHWRLYATIGALAGMMAILVIFVLQQQSTSQPDATVLPPTAIPFNNTPIGDTAWSRSRPLPQGKAHMAMAAVGLNIYLIGGETGEGDNVVVDGTVQRFNSATRVWETVAAKPTAVSDATAATLFGEVYVAGGKLDDGEITAVVEAYSPANDAWRPVASLPEPLSGGLTLSDGSYLYHIGGWNGNDYVNTVYLYDAAADSWRPLPSMAVPRAFAMGTQMAGQLVVVGGFNGEEALATCELFNIVDEQWTACADMLLPRMDGGGTAVLNKLYIIGGETEEAGSPAFAEQYDPNTDTWQIVNIPAETNGIGLRGNGVTHVETTIYSIGGSHQSGLITDTLVYTPIVYQTFIPAAAGGSE
jgi:DNA-binding CsgD family transcriptional regulator/N-acetylneuraminic acid mutarotase